MNQLGSQKHRAHCLVIVTISKQLVQIHTWVMRTIFCYAKYLHCRLVIVIIGTHNTVVLSTAAVNDIYIMIHVTHTAHQGQKKVFIRNVDTDLVVLGVAIVNELDFWECAHSCPLLFLILDPNNQEHFQWCMPWTGCDTTSSFHGKVRKSAWECWKVVPHVTKCICHLYMYTYVPAAIWRFIWHNWTCSQTTVNVLRRYLFSWT